MKRRALHYPSLSRERIGKPHCGTWGDVSFTTDIGAVTCRRCLSMLWQSIALAHVRANRKGPLRHTELHRRVRRAVADHEREVVLGD